MSFYLMATCKRPKKTISDFIARIWSAEHFNFRRYLIERAVIWKKNTICLQILIYDGKIKRLAENYSRSCQKIPLFHTGPESHELTRIDKYLNSWLNRTQFVMVLTDSRSP